MLFFCFNQKTAYEMRISDWSSDVCSSDLLRGSACQGAATARVFAAEGARVVIADLLDVEGAAVAAEIGASAMFYRLDVSDEAAWNALVAEIAAQWGMVDILINNAGIVHASSLLDLTKDEFERVLRINLIGAWLGIKAVATAMIAKGKGDRKGTRRNSRHQIA